jgi:hypothetical protein
MTGVSTRLCGARGEPDPDLIQQDCFDNSRLLFPESGASASSSQPSAPAVDPDAAGVTKHSKRIMRKWALNNSRHRVFCKMEDV